MMYGKSKSVLATEGKMFNAIALEEIMTVKLFLNKT